MRKTEMSVVDIKPECYESKHACGSFFYEDEEFPAGELDNGRTASLSVMTEFCYTLPFRFYGLHIKRKLIRMTLQLEKAQFELEGARGFGTSLYYVTDYTRSLISTAISRGELRYCSPEEMVSYYLSLTGELKELFATTLSPKLCLRSEVRRRVEKFLDKYTSEDWV